MLIVVLILMRLLYAFAIESTMSGIEMNLETPITGEELKAATIGKTASKIMMSPHEAAYLLRLLKNAKTYFEYGCGGSTKFVTEFGPPDLKIYSIDSSKEWIGIVLESSWAQEARKLGRLSIEHIDLGPIKAMGYPLEDRQEAFMKYSKAVGSVTGDVDVTLVDGRFRLACILQIFLQKPMSKVVIHDYFEPHHNKLYSHVLEFAEVIEHSESLTLMERKQNVTDTEIESTLWEKFRFIKH